MNRRSFLSLAALPIGGIPQSTGNKEYIGTIDDALSPEFSFMGMKTLASASNSEIAAIDTALPPSANFYSGSLDLPATKQPTRILLADLSTGESYLFADLNQDGRFSPSETFKFHPVPQRPKAIGDCILPIPIRTGPFKSFPIRFRVFPNQTQPGGPSDPGKRAIFYSTTAYIAAIVDIDRKQIRIWCEYDIEHPEQADAHHGVIGMDLDGDGVLAPFPSPERATARGEPVVFRTGEKYFSIAKVDLVSRTMTVRSHQQRDYLRVELKLGAHFPNFAFIDFAGHSHTLSDIKADCLLLDFWGSWCPPCLGEFPVLKRAYQTFKPRGFDILGIDSNESSAQARECILRNDLPWLQATSESTSEFADKRLDISTYPTLILLDKKRTIISLDREGPNLRGDQLLETLNHLLPFGPQI